MAFPTNPDLHVELLLGGTWVDLVPLGLVRIASGIQTKRGRDDEIANVQPGTCELVVDNAGGHFSPRNPNGQWFGLIGRNTPLRVWVRPHLTAGDGTDDADSFGRTVSNGWGSTAGGNAYTTVSVGGTIAASDYNVAAGVGTQSVPVAVGYRMCVPALPWAADVEIVATARQATADVLGGNLEVGGIALRCQFPRSFADVSGDYYLCRVEVGAAEAMTAKITRANGSDLASATVTGFAWTGQALRVRAQIIGDRIRYKVWDAAGAEPAAWTVQAQDSTITAAGPVGFRSGVGTGNTNTKPLVFSWDDITVTPIAARFYGEVSEWPTSWNIRGTNVWTSIQASGILRRLAQGAKTPRSPLARAYADIGPVAYWALDDGPYAVGAATTVSSGSQDGFAITGQLDLAQLDGPPGAPNKLPQMAQDLVDTTIALSSVLAGSTGTQYVVDLVLQATPAAAATFWSYIPVTWHDSNGNTFGITVSGDETFAPATYSIALFGYNDANPPGTDVTPTIPVNIADGQWHHVRVEIFTSPGVSTTGQITLDGGAWANDTQAGLYSAPVTSVQIYNNRKSDIDSASVGHIAFFAGTFKPGTYAAFAGNTGETIATRAARLATEDSTPITVRTASGGFLPLLTVQRTAGLVDLVRDIQAADLGVVVEDRARAGLTYRALSTITNQTPTSLPYTSVVPDLQSTDDDQRVWNTVVVERYNGSKTTQTLTTGTLSTATPPNGVGVYDRGVYESHVHTTESLDNVASWLLHLGTWDDTRWPAVPINFATPAVAANHALVWQLLTMDVGDALTIPSLPSWLPPGAATGIVQGYEETIGPKVWPITFTTTPAGPYTVAVYDAASSRYEPTTATLSASCTAGATSLSVATTGPRFVRAADDAGSLPFDVVIDGERITVTAVTGTSSPQTFTVTRSVNGVVKAHASGAAVSLYQPTCYAM